MKYSHNDEQKISRKKQEQKRNSVEFVKEQLVSENKMISRHNSDSKYIITQYNLLMNYDDNYDGKLWTANVVAILHPSYKLSGYLT